jgi:hypothetical protein
VGRWQSLGTVMLYMVGPSVVSFTLSGVGLSLLMLWLAARDPAAHLSDVEVFGHWFFNRL